MILLMGSTQSSQIYTDRKQNGAFQGLGNRKMGVVVQWVKNFRFKLEIVLEMDRSNGCNNLNIFNATELYI